MSAQQQPLVLDRDGVINVDVPGRYVCSAADWIPIDGALEAIGRLTASGYTIFVVSNQSGIGRGLFTEAELAAIQRKCEDALQPHGATVAGWFHCPHTPDDDCQCRKPKTGMLESVAAVIGRELDGAAFIGDKMSDLQAARAMRMRGILVGTGHGRSTLEAHSAQISEYFENLSAVANALIHGAVQPA